MVFFQIQKINEEHIKIVALRMNKTTTPEINKYILKNLNTDYILNIANNAVDFENTEVENTEVEEMELNSKLETLFNEIQKQIEDKKLL